MRPPRVLTTATAAISLVVGGESLAQQSVLEYRFAGMDACFTDPKDARAHEAFMLLGRRLAELQSDLDLEPEAGQAIDLAWDILAGAYSLRLDLVDQEPGIAFALTSVPADGASARSVIDRMASFAEMGGVPAERDDAGSMFFETPAGAGSIRLLETPAGGAAALTVGPAEPALIEFNSDLLPVGASPIMSMRADLAGLSRVLIPAIERDSPELAMLLTESGWLGEDAPSLAMAMGSTGNVTHSRAILYDAVRVLSDAGAGPEVVFSAEDFAVVPRDAVRVFARPLSFGSLLGLLETVEQEGGTDVLGEISRELGFNVRTDVLENLGPRSLLYQSDATGGGGMLSTVTIMELRDPGAFARAHRRAIDRFNQEMLDQAKGHIRIHTARRDDREVYSLMTPGIPIPLELAWAIAGDRLVIAFSPGSLEAALAQIDSGENSIVDSKPFKSAITDRIPENGISFASYADSSRLARRGYGLTSMLMAALANGVRAPSEPDRVSGSLMPSFSEFASDIRPSGAIAYWDGDDYVMDAQTDASMLVTFAAGAATLADFQGVAAAALGGGVMLPALGKARESARQLKSATQLRGITQGIIIYGMDNEQAMPASLDVLIAGGIVSQEMIESPFGPAFDGEPDFTFWFDVPGDQAFAFNDRQILGIDRAMLLSTGYETNVAFADNHIERLSTWELDELLAEAQNEGAREALGIPDL